MPRKPAKEEPEITSYPPTPPPAISNPLDEILSSYQIPANMLRVEILRSHDGRYEGQIIDLPNNDQTAGLISGGYVMVVPPTILGVETFQ